MRTGVERTLVVAARFKARGPIRSPWFECLPQGIPYFHV